MISISLFYRNIIQLYSTQFQQSVNLWTSRILGSRIGKSFLITISPAPLCNRKSLLETFFSSEMNMELVSLKWPHAISWDFMRIVCLTNGASYIPKPLVFQARTCAPTANKKSQKVTYFRTAETCGSNSKELRTTMSGPNSEYEQKPSDDFLNINNQPIDFRLNLDLHNDFHSSRLGMPGTSPGTQPGTPWQAGSGSRRWFSPSFKHNRITENINWISNLTGYTVIGYDKIFYDILESLTTPFDDLWRLLFVSLCLGDTAKRGDSGGDPPHKAGGPGIALSTLGWSFRVLFWKTF